MLLALGLVSWRWPIDKYHRLLDTLVQSEDEMSEVFPRIAILLGRSLPELVNDPPEHVRTAN